MPWLVGTALIHSLAVTEKRGAFKSWTVLLAIIAFSLSLLGTFLVRSGVLTSVHAFATDPARGIFILVPLASSIGGSLALYAGARRRSRRWAFQPVWREDAAAGEQRAAVLGRGDGAARHALSAVPRLAGGGTISVGPPYFHAIFVPIIVPLIVAAAVGPFLGWKRGDLVGALQRLWLAALAALGAVLLTLWLRGVAIGPAIGLGLAAWLGCATLVEWAERVKLLRSSARESLRRARNLPRATYGMTLAHFGLAVLIAGVTASSAWKEERVLRMKPGDSTEIAGQMITLESVDPVVGPNYTAMQAHFVTRRGLDLEPQRRAATGSKARPPPKRPSTAMVLRIFTPVIGEGNGAEGWVVRLYHQPLVPWIWRGRC